MPPHNVDYGFGALFLNGVKLGEGNFSAESYEEPKEMDISANADPCLTGLSPHHLSYTFEAKVTVNGTIKDLINPFEFAPKWKKKKINRKRMIERAKKLCNNHGIFTFEFEKEGDEYVCQRGPIRLVLPTMQAF